MSEFKTRTLSSAAVEVLGQLFTNGPTWDGNVASKSGRDELIELGLAGRTNGWAYITQDGVTLAVEWDTDHLKRMHSQRWYRKAKLNE